MEHEVTLDVAQGLLPAAARACEQEVCEHEGIAGLGAHRAALGAHRAALHRGAGADLQLLAAARTTRKYQRERKELC